MGPDAARHPRGARAEVRAAAARAVRVPHDLPTGSDGASVARALFDLTARDSGPSLSAHVGRHATDDQLHELLVHRSIYQLKEADPHTWAVPRLSGRPKAALVEIQADEYGGRAHARRAVRPLDAWARPGRHPRS